MFIDILRQYPDIISGKDYLFLDGTRKYSYHWQDALGHCIIRWDNAPHHQAVSTFPFHKHLGGQETIAESPPMKLHAVLDYISGQIISAKPH